MDRTARVPASVLANDRIWLWCWDDLVGKALLGGTLGALVGMLLCFGFAIWIRSEGKEAARDRFISGTQIVTERALAKLTRKATNARSIRIASVGIPAWLECRHFALLGTTGAGKTTVMRQMLDQVEARGEPAWSMTPRASSSPTTTGPSAATSSSIPSMNARVLVAVLGDCPSGGCRPHRPPARLRDRRAR
jgi:hypothetical protein